MLSLHHCNMYALMSLSLITGLLCQAVQKNVHMKQVPLPFSHQVRPQQCPLAAAAMDVDLYKPPRSPQGEPSISLEFKLSLCFCAQCRVPAAVVSSTLIWQEITLGSVSQQQLSTFAVWWLTCWPLMPRQLHVSCQLLRDTRRDAVWHQTPP